MTKPGLVPTRPSGQHSIPHFGLADMARLCGTLRKIGRSATSMEETADRIVGWLYDSLVDHGGDRASLLVRCFKTHRVANLPAGRARAAATTDLVFGGSPEPRCLALLATAGRRLEWKERRDARDSGVIALAPEAILFEAALVASLFDQIGLTEPASMGRQGSRGSFPPGEPFGIVHVPVAAGSAALRQYHDFVDAERIASVVAIGGPLPRGDAYVLTVFSNVAIGSETAELFKPMAVSVKLALSEHADRVFT